MKTVTLKLSLSIVFYCALAWSAETYSESNKTSLLATTHSNIAATHVR